MCRIEAFQSQACILGSELPIHPGLGPVPGGLPGGNLAGKDIHAVDAAIQAFLSSTTNFWDSGSFRCADTQCKSRITFWRI